MIVDTSAILAVMFQEPVWKDLVEKLLGAGVVGVGAPTMVESSLVLLGRLDRDPRMLTGWFLQEFDVEVVPFGPEHWLAAADAFRRFGRGRHPAALNFGDCMSYATAKLSGQPLLFVGGDFPQTDIEAA